MQVVLPSVFDVAKPERSEAVRRRVAAALAARAAPAAESETGSERLRDFAKRRGTSPSNWAKALRVARTIAALAGGDVVRERHVYEAIKLVPEEDGAPPGRR
ncbi:hypothetical protein [Polyangium sp. 15x6]|uniref:magnesium chelatase subunit ChlI family protein n=1 Tax=Polyangium sp. 15x6 TaxID=3042687 RepID=UPI00249C38FC|nr:hypothetical protein [Polyangium sp. 15x6]MDI3292166.1 hypothetical protein [Polyangium sp. 15x6]